LLIQPAKSKRILTALLRLILTRSTRKLGSRRTLSLFIFKNWEDGSTTTTKWRAVKGSIYTDNGTKITAYKATTAVSVEVTNANGFVDQKASTAQTAALSGSDNVATAMETHLVKVKLDK